MKTNSFSNHTLRRIARIVLLLVILASARAVFSQSVTILPSSITPNQSGAIPRLAYDAIMALSTPQNGDMAYDVTFNCMRLYKKNKWVKMLNDTDLKNPSVIGWQMGGLNDDLGTSIATDASGNVYVTGTFKESALFDEDTELTGVGSEYIIFIAKYTSIGQLLWVQKAGSYGGGHIQEMALDANGNIYLTGYFYGNTTLGTATFTSAGSEDIFLAKYNNNGVFQWAQQAGGIHIDNGKDLGVDSDGNVYITGIVRGNAFFGGVNYLGNADNDIFIAKYNSSGTLQWLRRGATDGQDTVSGLVVDTNGKLTIIGSFYDNTTFGSTTLTSMGSRDIFLTQYDSDGNFVWAKRIGGPGLDAGVDVVVDANNNLFISGTFSGTSAFGGTVMESAGGEDIFIAKVDNNGFVAWSKRDGGTKDEKCNTIAVDTKGNIYVAGTFYAQAIFGNTILLAKEYSQLFIAKYDLKGDFEWVKDMGGDGNEIAYKIITDTKGNAFAAGTFNLGFVVEETSFNSKGLYDAFVVRLRD